MARTIAKRMRRFGRRLRLSTLAPRRARRALDAVEELADVPDLRFAAQLLTSEIVANSVRHAAPSAGSIALLIACDEDTLRVEVADGGRGFDVLELLATHRHHNERHRGIALVDALADRWGFRRGDDSFRIWFELDLVPGRRAWRGRDPIPRSHTGRDAAAGVGGRSPQASPVEGCGQGPALVPAADRRPHIRKT